MTSFETLKQVNEKLRSELIRLRPNQRHCSTVTPQDFADLLTEILQGAECLRVSTAQSQTAAFAQQTSEYRTNPENLRDFLPELQSN
jgi:hypothetical protein